MTILHRDIALPCHTACVVDLRHRRVANRCRGACLTYEALQRLRALYPLYALGERQHFECYLPVQRLIARQVDYSACPTS